jgi:hypothetical protein
MQFDSPENRYAQAQQNLSKAQSDRSSHSEVSIALVANCMFIVRP